MTFASGTYRKGKHNQTSTCSSQMMWLLFRRTFEQRHDLHMRQSPLQSSGKETPRKMPSGKQVRISHEQVAEQVTPVAPVAGSVIGPADLTFDPILWGYEGDFRPSRVGRLEPIFSRALSAIYGIVRMTNYFVFSIIHARVKTTRYSSMYGKSRLQAADTFSQRVICCAIHGQQPLRGVLGAAECQDWQARGWATVSLEFLGAPSPDTSVAIGFLPPRLWLLLFLWCLRT